MFIERLDLENFGPFVGEQVDGLGPGLNVIHGRNEAGKSALRAFLRAILFGFPRGRLSERDTWLYVYPPAGGGSASGAVHLATARGERYAVRRREGAHGGPVEVWGDAQGGNELLSELLGRIGPELYQNVFSISLSELQDYDAMKQAGVRDRIYSAGLGLVGTSLPDAMKQLDDERSSPSGLWSPQSGRLRKLLRELAEMRGKLEEARSHQARYEELGKRRQTLRASDAECRERIQRLRSEEAMLSKLLELRPHWLRAQSWSRGIAQLPDPGGFPRDGMAALDGLQGEEARLREEIDQGDRDQEGRERSSAGLPIIPAFEQRSADVERLLGEVEYYKAAARDLPERWSELETEETNLAGELRSLGPSWDEPALEDPIDLSALQSRLRETGEALTNAVEAREAAAGRLAYRRERREEAESAAGDARARFDSMAGKPSISGLSAGGAQTSGAAAASALSRRGSGDRGAEQAGAPDADLTSSGDSLAGDVPGRAEPGVSPPSETVEALEARYSRWERVRRALIERSTLERDLRDHESRWAEVRARSEQRGGPSRWVTAIAVGAVMVGIVFAILGGVLDQPLAVGAGILLGAAGIVGTRRGLVGRAPSVSGSDPSLEAPGVTLDRVRRDLQAQVGAKREELRELLEEIPAADPRSEAEAQEHIDGLRREIDRRRELDRLQEQLDEAEGALSQAQARETEAQSRLDEAESVLRDADAAWRETLQAARLNADLQPADALASVERIRRVLQRHGNVRALRKRVRDISEAVADLEERLRTVITEAGMPDFEPRGGVPSLEHLQRRYDEHRAAVEQRRTLAQQDAQWASKRAQLEASLEGIEKKRVDLLSRAGATDEAAFREMGQRVQERVELERKLGELKENHPELFDEGGSEYARRLESATDEEIHADLEVLRSDIAGAEKQREAGLNEIGSIDRDRRALEEENPVAGIQAEIGQLEERSQELAGRWAVLTIAKHFIETTRDEFQRERQAPLLQAASAYFRRFTSGRYTTVQNVIGEERIVVADRELDGRQKEVGALSRGTREQLLLAMRFALIDEYARNAESLPVLMDDVMVNFDPERSRAVCEGAVELGSRHQVLVLTCHPATIEALGEASAAAGAGEPPHLDLSGEARQLSLSAGR